MGSLCDWDMVAVSQRGGADDTAPRILQDAFHHPFIWLFDTWQYDGTAGSTSSDNGLGGTRMA